MSNYAVFGAGMMGRVIARDLIESEPDARVLLLDRSPRLLVEAKETITSERLRPVEHDASSRSSILAGIDGEDIDVMVGALPHRLSLTLVEGAVEAGVHLVDLVGEEPAKRHRLHQAAVEKDCLVVPGCGVAPGISNVCVARGVELLDVTEEAIVYVGGIPRRGKPPLYYETVYLLESVFNAYRREARLTRGGELVEVPPLSGREEVDFPDPVGTLEAFYTDGLGSLTLTMGARVRGELSEKTLRYPGHLEAIELLRDCGLLADRPVLIGGIQVRPVELVVRTLEDKLRLGQEGDILAMRVVVDGEVESQKRRHSFELVDFYDPQSDTTAMARTTGYTAAITARRIASGAERERGVRFPEELFSGAAHRELMTALAAKGVEVTHTES